MADRRKNEHSNICACLGQPAPEGLFSREYICLKVHFQDKVGIKSQY